MNSRLLSSLALVLLVVGCATPIAPVATGEVSVRERLKLRVDQPWNQFNRTGNDAITVWTNEGITVDRLEFLVGLKDGGLLAPTPNEPKGQPDLSFKSSMQAQDVANMLQTLWTRGGSTFNTVRLAPHPFLGQQGYVLEYEVVRKQDDVRLKGTAWFAVIQGELHMMNFSAPRLTFYPRYLPRAQALAQAARLQN